MKNSNTKKNPSLAIQASQAGDHVHIAAEELGGVCEILDVDATRWAFVDGSVLLIGVSPTQHVTFQY